jgi:riboflavin synthase
MFTGIVEEIGRVRSALRAGDSARLVIEAATVLAETGPGDSISIDGVCQTVTGLLRKPGDRVNLERSLRADARLGGHIVQGHVSGVASIREIRRSVDNVYLSVELPVDLMRYCVREGSIALDGISLTIADLVGTRVVINVIPATLERTTLTDKRPGDQLNVETDIIGRYVERLLSAYERPGMTTGRMQELGY